MKQNLLFKTMFVLAALLMVSTKMQAQEPYAVLSDDNTVLTFYYDNDKAERGGMGVGPFEYDTTIKAPTTTWYEYRSSIQNVIFDASFANCLTLSSTAFWFYGLSNLISIEGIENLKTDNVEYMMCMFTDCSSLTSLDVSGFNTSNVTDMISMFNGCSSLTSLDVSSFNTSNVTLMGDMFSYCSSLTSLDLSGFNTEKVTYMPWMFEGCSSLTSLDLSSFNTSNVTRMSDMFYSCRSLTTIYAGSEWSTASITKGSSMFDGCTSLVGGAGTVYDGNHIDYTYAHVDGGAENPGYFTYKSSTGINRLAADGQDADKSVDGPVFSLSGQRLAAPRKGINILGGRKVVVK